MNRTHAVITAVLMNTLAIAYLFVMDRRVVDGQLIKWDSSLGHVLLTPAVILVIYSWLMIGVSIFLKEGDHGIAWHAKRVHLLDKHESLVE